MGRCGGSGIGAANPPPSRHLAAAGSALPPARRGDRRAPVLVEGSHAGHGLLSLVGRDSGDARANRRRLVAFGRAIERSGLRPRLRCRSCGLDPDRRHRRAWRRSSSAAPMRRPAPARCRAPRSRRAPLHSAAAAVRRRRGRPPCRRGRDGPARRSSCAANSGHCRHRDARTECRTSDNSRRRRARGAGRSALDLRHRHIGIMHVHGFAEHVLGMLGDSFRASPQHRVGGRRTIGGDDLDRLGRAGFAIGLPNHVEQFGIHVGFVVVAPVAQEVVELAAASQDHIGRRRGRSPRCSRAYGCGRDEWCAYRHWRWHFRCAPAHRPGRETPGRRSQPRRKRETGGPARSALSRNIGLAVLMAAHAIGRTRHGEQSLAEKG